MAEHGTRGRRAANGPATDDRWTVTRTPSTHRKVPSGAKKEKGGRERGGGEGKKGRKVERRRGNEKEREGDRRYSLGVNRRNPQKERRTTQTGAPGRLCGWAGSGPGDAVGVPQLQDCGGGRGEEAVDSACAESLVSQASGNLSVKARKGHVLVFAEAHGSQKRASAGTAEGVSVPRRGAS